MLLVWFGAAVGFLLGVWWASRPSGGGTQVLSVKPYGKTGKLEVVTDQAVYLGSATVWHRVTPDGLFRASTSMEMWLSDAWETYEYRHPGWREK
jgi:hypothetical protein